MPIEYFFPTIIMHEYLYQYENANLEFEKRIYEIREKYPNCNSTWACKTYNTANVYDLNQDSLFVPIIEDISSLIHILLKEYNLSCNVRCTAAWANIAEKNDFQESHRHPNNHFSAVYYVKASEGCGDLIFDNQQNMFPLPPSESINNTNRIRFIAEPCKVIIFPSSLSHTVLPNSSEEDRISIAFNFIVE